MKKILFGVFSLFSLCLLSCTPPSDIIIDDEEEKVEEGATSINMWMMDFQEWENRINISQRKKFNSNINDGIQLNQNYINKNNFDEMIRSAYESKNVPDIYMVSYGNLYKEISSGRAIDISGLFSNETWSDLTDTAKTAVTYDGKHYGFPINLEPSTILAYRKDLLKEYGKVEEIPTKWADFLTLCGTMKSNLKSANKKNIYPFGVPTGVACAWGTWGLQASATGGLAVTDDWSTSRITEPGYKEICELWATVYGNGYVPLSSGEYTESIFDVCDGKAITTMCGSWSFASVLNMYPELKDQVGFIPLPTFDGSKDKVTATNGGWCYVISSECKDKAKAAEVIKFLVAEDTEQSVDYFSRAFYSKFATRKSVQALVNEKASKQNDVPKQWIDTLNDVASRAILEPIYDWNISVAVEGMFEESAMGNDIDETIAKCDKTVKDIISRNNLAGTNPRLK